MFVASRAADHSTLWLIAAAGLALAGGERGRRAAARGLLAIGITSPVVNLLLKPLSRRARPRFVTPARGRPMIRRPRSFAFPSGHAASAFAFAGGSALEAPAVAPPVIGLAGVVSYSRIYLGVHYVGDVVAGAVLGALGAVASGSLLDAVDSARARRRPVSALTAPAGRRVVLVVSPSAGRADALEPCSRQLRDAGFELLDTIEIGDLSRLDELLGDDDALRPLVVAAGGDGTIGAVADRVANSDVVLGILPLGTSNDFARSLRIPTNPGEAVRLLAEGKVATVDLGRVNIAGEAPLHFVHAATAGLNVSFAKLATRASLRRRLGRLTYAAAGAAALREHQPFDCELHYGEYNERFTLTHLAIINAPVFGGFLGLRLGDADLDDRALDVLAVEPIPWRRLLLAGAYAALGIKRQVPGIHARQVRSVHVHTPTPLEVTLDGELAGRIPADFEIAGEALRIVVPQDFEDIDD